MGVESVGVEAAPYGPRRFPHLTDRQSPGSFAEGLESKGLKYWAGANRMGPYVFGSSMATQAGERSSSEGTQNPSDFRFGGFTGASSPSSSDGGFVNRTVSVSELLAFRSRGGKASGKQTPTVLKDSIPATPSFSGLNFSSGGSNINGSTSSSFSGSLPKVVHDGPSPVAADGRESSAAAPKDPKYGTSSFSAFTAGLKPTTSSPFVFTAGATSDTGLLKSGTQTNVPSGRSPVFSGPSRPASQSRIPSDGLFSTVPRAGVQPSVGFDSSVLGSSGPASQTNASFSGSSQPAVQSNAFSERLFSTPSRPSAQASSSTEPTSNSSFFKSVDQADIPFEELLAANATQQGVGGGVPKSAPQRNRLAEADQGISIDISRKLADQGVSVDISRKLNQLEIDKGIDKGVNLLPKMKTLDLNKDGEKIPKAAAFTAESEIGNSLKNLDIDKGESLPLKMEKLVVNNEGKTAPSGKGTFQFGAQSTSVPGDRNPSCIPFAFGAASTPARAGNSAENQRPEAAAATPAAPAPAPAFKFSAEGEVKTPVSKAKKDKFQHRPVRAGQKSILRGKKGASTHSSGRSEAATPSPSRDGVSMDISPQSTNEASTSSQSGYPGFGKSSLVPEYDDGDSDEESGGASEVNSMSDLEASVIKLRAAVSELNFGAGLNRAKDTSNTAPFSNVKEQEYLNKSKEEASSSAGYGQGWKRTPVADTKPGERAGRENERTGQGDLMNERDEMNSGADRNEDGPETSSGPESSTYTDDSQNRVEGEAKGPVFTFQASPTGMSSSNLRRRTRKVQWSVKADKAPIPVVQPNKTGSRPLPTMKSGTWSATAPLAGLGGSGLGGSGYGEGASPPGVGAAAAAEQVCERWRLRGNQAYAKGDFVKAEEFYSLGAGSVSPHETSQSCIRASMLCYSNRAATRMVVGRMREALADCRHAMAVDSSFVRVHLRAAGCHLALGEIELAAAAYKDCLRQAQEASKIDSKVLADASEGLKKAQMVAEHITQAKKLVHNNSSADSVTALRLLNEAILASAQSELLLELKAYTLLSLQRYTEAVQVCDQSLALAERNVAGSEAISNKSEYSPLNWRRRMTVKANFHLGKLEEALEQLQQLQDGPFSMFPPDADTPGALSAEMSLPSMAVIKDLLRHKSEGNKAFQAGKFSEALEHYTAALARNGESRPFCAVCLCNRAAASQSLGHIADAIADCSRAIALDPRYAKAISRRASLHEKVRDYGQSCCDLGRLIAIYERQQPQARSLRVDGAAGASSEELQQTKERLVKAEEEMKKGFPLDHYSILGLELGCSASEIKKAYRKAALRHHPDKAGQFLMRGGGDTGEDASMDESLKKEGERLLDEVRKDSEQLFKLIGEGYAVLSDPAKRARYDSDEELRKLRTRSSDLAKNVYGDRKQTTRSSEFKSGWSSSASADPGSQSRASRQRERWEGFNYQYQRWHPGPDAAQPDVYARRGRPTGSTYGSSHRSTSWRWEEYPWEDV